MNTSFCFTKIDVCFCERALTCALRRNFGIGSMAGAGGGLFIGSAGAGRPPPEDLAAAASTPSNLGMYYALSTVDTAEATHSPCRCRSSRRKSKRVIQCGRGS